MGVLLVNQESTCQTKIMAVGEVSENPSSNAVTRPTVPQSRDENIERMLRLYGIFTAFGLRIFHLAQRN
jgi:hypothetical protein